jgi:hypothetical protein
MTLFRLLLVALVAALHATASLAEPVFPPGSRIGLVPPPGMSLSNAFQGFQDPARAAMLVVTELSAQTFAKIERDFAPEAMRAGGMEEILREQTVLSSGPALLVAARFTEKGSVMRKWALLAQAGGITAVVVAVIPEGARDAYPDAALRAAFASIAIRAKLSADEMMGVLPYRLDDLGGFRLLRTNPDGTAVLTFGPNDTTLPVEQPYFLVAPRAAEMPPLSERDRFSQRVLMTFVNRPDLRIVTSEQIRIGGAPGHEIIAESIDERANDPLMIVQWLRFDTGLVQMFGIARKDQWADVLPRMRALRDGFAPR